MVLKKGLIILGLLMAVISAAMQPFDYKIAKASSGTVSLYTTESTYAAGDEVELVVDINSTAGISFVDLELLYDSSLLEFVSGDEGVAAEDGLIQISDHFSRNKNRKKYKVTFLALGEGSWEFLTTTEPLIYDASFEVMSVSTLRTTVTITREKEEEAKALLSYLRVVEGEIVPEFSPERTKYELNVSNEVESLTIYADSEDDSHQVTIEGNSDLKEGSNSVVIKVTDRSGNENSYIISVYRNSLKEDESAAGEEETKEPEKDEETKKPEENEENEGEDDPFMLEGGEGLRSRMINERLNLLLSQRFIMIPLPENVAVPTGYEKTQLILDGNSLTAYTLADDLENDFLLFYGKLKGGKEGFYFYDRVDKTLQRYNGNPYLHTDRNMTVMDENTYERKLSGLRVALAAVTGLFVAALIGLLSMVLRNREKQELDK